ncbi:hypothetical protein D9V32_09520 [Mycetocola tolaasinivorans]|uniref:Uncharacterized protein n=1 Tax=Mycetocola tolaasinivorans TaxID=76635 RepID=A0A3L7A643_9MICO|nr:hypothetical protein [Mycetocola tolaasinivorans]RLP75697.1 hypothetical protein D9V32_09520 [Mycetocola tolaasinivorans]
MSIDAALRLIARTLPAPARARYLEEWRADAAAASVAGIREGTVVRGALSLALTLDRDSPLHTLEPRGTVPRRLARRGIARFSAAAILLLGTLASSGAPGGAGDSPVAVTAVAIAFFLMVLVGALSAVSGALLLSGAAWVSRTPLARITLAAAVIGPVCVALALLHGNAHPGVLWAGVLLTGFGLISGLCIALSSVPLRREERETPRAPRILISTLGLVAMLAVLALGATDILLWGPQAASPAMDIGTIYARMVTDDGFNPALTFVAVWIWAAFWGALAIALLVFGALPGPSWLDARRTTTLTLLLISGALLFWNLAGFGIGMSLGDTFETFGGQVSFASSVLHLVGVLALAAAALLLGRASGVGSGHAPRRAPAVYGGARAVAG